MLFYTSDLTSALQDRFDDIDEISDVARYGCSGGVSGFIYNTECAEFFDTHEDVIEDVCYDMLGDDWIVTLCKYNKIMSILELKTYAVWFTVEAYCQAIMQDIEESMPA
jgi:hypothetical protein